jgi:hypothetical protein
VRCALRYIIRFIVTITILLSVTSCNTPVSSTTSYIQIINKKIHPKNKYLIEAKNPYDKNAKTFNITIDDENLWNLIKVDQIYLSIYEYKDINKKVKLLSIKYPSELNENNRKADY